jgi:hypothetical protein
MTKHKTILLSLVIAVFVLTALTIAATKRRPKKSPPAAARPAPTPPVTSTARHVRRSALRPQLIPNLIELGDRIERPGKERLNIIGTLTRGDSSRRLPFQAVMEFPDHFRLTIQEGIQTRVLMFDGSQVAALGDAINTGEREMIETLVCDTAEHFFEGQMESRATRAFGTRFRTDDGTDSNYNGPYYDIYEMSEVDNTAAQAHQSVKQYFFNSDTRLLEKVRYETGTGVTTETLMQDWRKVNGQSIPRRVERRQNDQSVFVMTINAVTVGPGLADGIFGVTAN